MKIKNNNLEQIKDHLIKIGYKLTDQRLQIIKVFLGSKHMNAYEIYQEVKEYNIGLSTVYRTLTSLEEFGILKRINGRDICYYELVDFDEQKVDIHAKCIKCNNVIDIDEIEASEELSALIKKMKDNHDVTIKSSSIILSGVCGKCEIR